jgi:hypothetical protein
VIAEANAKNLRVFSLDRPPSSPKTRLPESVTVELEISPQSVTWCTKRDSLFVGTNDGRIVELSGSSFSPQAELEGGDVLTTGSKTSPLAHTGVVHQLQFLGTGQLLSLSGPGRAYSPQRSELRLWDPAGTERHRVSSLEPGALRVLASASGRWALLDAGSERRAEIWALPR